jgi:hypothetical protein
MGDRAWGIPQDPVVAVWNGAASIGVTSDG